MLSCFEEADPQLLRRPVLQSRERPVGRRIVQNHEFKVAEGLAEDARDRLIEKRQRIVHWHHDAH
jgi:hypothetical protein